jgi:hypothetical protein
MCLCFNALTNAKPAHTDEKPALHLTASQAVLQIWVEPERQAHILNCI